MCVTHSADISIHAQHPYLHIKIKLEDIILSKRADVFYTKQCRVVRHHDTPLLFKALFEYEQDIPTECILI